MSRRTGENVVYRNRPSSLQHAVHLPIECRLVWDIHRHVLRPNDIEGVIWECEVERIALLISHEMGQSVERIRVPRSGLV